MEVRFPQLIHISKHTNFLLEYHEGTTCRYVHLVAKDDEKDVAVFRISRSSSKPFNKSIESTRLLSDSKFTSIRDNVVYSVGYNGGQPMGNPSFKAWFEGAFQSMTDADRELLCQRLGYVSSTLSISESDINVAVIAGPRCSSCSELRKLLPSRVSHGDIWGTA